MFELIRFNVNLNEVELKKKVFLNIIKLSLVYSELNEFM